MGRLIPAGTGTERYQNLQIPPDAPVPEEEIFPLEGPAEAEMDVDTDRFAEMIRAAAAAAAGTDRGQPV